MKQAFPDLTLVGIGGEYGPHCAETIRAALEAAGAESMDAWSIHPYRYPRTPEASDLAGEVSRLADQVRAAGATTRAWVTEIGYPTHRGNSGCSEAEQARLLVRTLALLQSTRAVDATFWYDLKDDGLTRDYNEHNFGLIHHQQFNCAPKPGIVAASAFIRLTHKAAFRQLHRTGDLWIVHYETPDRQDLLVAWTPVGSRTTAFSGEITSVVNLMGHPQPAGPKLQLTPDPIYVLGRNLRGP